MSVRLFIGGLAWATDDESLRAKFKEFGQVLEASVVRDRESGRSRGFGFVTYASEDEAKAAIDAMDNRELDGRPIRVQHATAREGGERRGFGSRDGGERRGFGSRDGGYQRGGYDRQAGSFGRETSAGW